ncbi:hypothetical protein [Cohnella phaseoli]|uniref:Uncharacterized protein n=1 Tax=Cohnella phaseoli TaxID=456490 RepID=A0A3D9KIR3_9BACL|nr:hypothetical protein [Cohnella phaseoli]RED86335.1 hypothetical protein DFP98_103190 [Cohnella phaseoli]
MLSNNNNGDEDVVTSDTSLNSKTCFVIMPIAEIEAYGNGHFSRVYDYIIKPACLAAGFIPIRADEVKQANVIVIDILKKIIESEMVICDLSSKNANVFYELGIRQAFNLPAVLIKDDITGRVFDISPVRDEEYDHKLRIDNVTSAVERISKSLINTYESHGKDDGQINSLVSMLNISPAQLTAQSTISNETRLILNSIEQMNNRLDGVEGKLKIQDNYNHISNLVNGNADFFSGEITGGLISTNFKQKEPIKLRTPTTTISNPIKK